MDRAIEKKAFYAIKHCTLISDLRNRGNFQNPRKNPGDPEKKSGFQGPDFRFKSKP